MWFLRNILWLAIMVVVVGFAILNMKETVSAVHVPGHVYRAVPANVAVFVAFVAGMFLAFVLVLFRVLRTRADLNAIEREKRDLLLELDQLRNLPLDGFTTDTKAGGGR